MWIVEMESVNITNIVAMQNVIMVKLAAVVRPIVVSAQIVEMDFVKIPLEKIVIVVQPIVVLVQPVVGMGFVNHHWVKIL